MTSVGIEPTTSGLDLPLLCRLSYEVGQRKSGTIKVVNRGEEKVRVHMNFYNIFTTRTIRESSFNMARRGDEDIEGGLRKFVDTRKEGSEGSC